ncbi:hypothetical protein HMPREF0577_1567 [Mobiluncus mulieris ATCC 35243]|nr:hypothetical protein HMPREF0577_1567 [Mobiluncus mulieris ATCC 35243]
MLKSQIHALNGGGGRGKPRFSLMLVVFIAIALESSPGGARIKA